VLEVLGVLADTIGMFLRSKTRKKDGKEHRYWSVVENRRVADGRVVQRHVLYLGEINDAQRAAWWRSIAVFDEDRGATAQMALFPEDRPAPELACAVVQVKLSGLQLRHARQWGACWLACELWRQLELDAFWQPRLPPSRKGTRWVNVLKTLVAYRLIDPGSEWRLHRSWYERSAMGDLLGEDFAIAHSDTLYRCLDKLLKHKEALFSHLQARWRQLFDARFEVLLYDLTSTYFECDPPESGKRRFGYSRDKRFDCVQVVIALIVTPDGFPLAYEVLPGNTLDHTTLKDFLAKIEAQYGKADRVWVMDRGIPTDETLALMRDADPPVHYLVGTPKGRLTKLEQSFLAQPWTAVREQVAVKLLNKDGETYVLALSAGRRDKEQAMRRRRLKRLWKRLHELLAQAPSRDQLLLKLGAAKKDAGRAYGLVTIRVPAPDQPVTPDTFTFAIDRNKLRQVRRREGHYLLRCNLGSGDPAQLWTWYIQLTEVEQAFKELKGDLGIRPIYHQLDARIEAHIFIAFLAYCLQVTLKARLRPLASGLTPRSALEKFAAIQMVDVHLPTTDGRTLILSRYTEPEPEQQILLDRLRLRLPEQPPPRIASALKGQIA
jgi:transposase